jgi:hypothetical protein
MFTSAGPTSPPASLLRRRGYPCGKFLGFEGLDAKFEGSLVRLIKFQGFLRKMILTPYCASSVTLKNHIKSEKNPKTSNTILLFSV